jgi:hypothetical protein
MSTRRSNAFNRCGRLARQSAGSVALALFLPLAACSGHVSAPTTAAEACDALSASRCSKLESCNPNGLLTTYGEVDICKTREQRACAVRAAANGSGATADSLTACSHAYDALSCDEVLQGVLPIYCDIHGSLAQGSACVSDMQCAGSNGYCRVQSGICGTCASRGAAGADCLADVDCQHALVCGKGANPAMVSPALQMGTCMAPGGDGTGCSGSNTCLATLACVNFVCVERTPAGARCQVIAQNCDGAHGFVCDGTGLCEQARTAIPGGACGLSSVDLSITECTGGAWCNTNGTGFAGTCESALADGASCDAMSGPFCLAPAACTNGVCVFPDAAACN